MELQLSSDDLSFRDEVRDFLQQHLHKSVSDLVKYGYGVSKDIQDDWTRTFKLDRLALAGKNRKWAFFRFPTACHPCVGALRLHRRFRRPV